MDPTALLTQSTTMSSPAASQSSTLSTDSEESIHNCAECSDVATTEVMGSDAQPYSLCARCAGEFQETVAELEQDRSTLYSWDYTAVRWCEDCRESAAVREFMHLRKGTFFLCDSCFMWADHEDDYLERERIA
jgi:hypothetical protein